MSEINRREFLKISGGTFAGFISGAITGAIGTKNALGKNFEALSQTCQEYLVNNAAKETQVNDLLGEIGARDQEIGDRDSALAFERDRSNSLQQTLDASQVNQAETPTPTPVSQETPQPTAFPEATLTPEQEQLLELGRYFQNERFSIVDGKLHWLNKKASTKSDRKCYWTATIPCEISTPTKTERPPTQPYIPTMPTEVTPAPTNPDIIPTATPRP